MIWETYKNMTEKQKEEWEFRFNHYDSLVDAGRAIGGLILTFIAFFIINLFASYLIITQERFGYLKVYLDGMVIGNFRLFGVVAAVIFITAIAHLVTMVVAFYQEYKWKKENNIKGR